MKRLVIVSNRVMPVTSKKVMVGGLAAGVLAALRESGGVWFGWSGNVSESPAAEPVLTSQGRISYLTCDLNARDYDQYYNGFANQNLWPLFHYRLDLTNFERDWYESYRRVNQDMAHKLLPYLTGDDLIWVHDYHMIPFGEELRHMGVADPIGFFVHTPFPPADLLITLPCHENLFRSLLSYDLVGFQTANDLRNFHDYISRETGGTVDPDGTVHAHGRIMQSGVFPIGIDTEDFVALGETHEAQRQAQRLAQSLIGRDLIVGVDRTDYSKGLLTRLRAFELLLETYPIDRSRVHLLQVTPPSREAVPEYARMERELDALSGHINGRFAEFDWVPIRYIHRAYNRRELAGFFRVSRVGLVTPSRDGMNLVAKEYVAAQDPDNPGVLVLSRFAGAARQMDRALVVNPFDVYAISEAIQEALEMPLDERKGRWSEMLEDLRREDIDHWRESFVSKLVAVNRKQAAGAAGAAGALRAVGGGKKRAG